MELKPTSTNLVSYLFAECSYTAYGTGSRVPKIFYNHNPIEYDYLDLESMWFGKTQYVNMQIPTSIPANLFITLFNLDPNNINYELKV